MKRKIVSILLSAVLLVSCMPFCAAGAFAATSTVGISSAEAQPGESIDLTVTLAGNPGITSIDFSVQYDAKQFELTAKKNGNLLGGTMNSQTLDKVPYYCGWINSLQRENCKDDGVLITLTFKVKAGATNGKHPITFAEKTVTGYNADIKAVSFTPENGYIEVKNGKESVKPSTPSGGGTTQAAPVTPNQPAQPSKPENPGKTDDGSITPSNPANSDNALAGEKTLTAAQKKTIAGVKETKIKFTTVKYNRTKKAYTLKYKKTNKKYKLDGYQIYKSTKKFGKFKKVGTTKKLTWTDKNPGKKGSAHYYKVRGFRKVAGKIYYTNWSVKKKLTV